MANEEASYAKTRYSGRSCFVYAFAHAYLPTSIVLPAKYAGNVGLSPAIGLYVVQYIR